MRGVKEQRNASQASAVRVLALTPVWGNCALLEQCVTPLGGEVLQAFDTGDAVRKSLKYHPEFILVDVALFGNEGVEFIRQIQRASSPKTVNIFAVTSQDVHTLPQQQFIQHCDAVFSTPIDTVTLHATICQHLQNSAPIQ